MKNCELRYYILNFNTISKCNENLWNRKLGINISLHYDLALKATKESRLRLLHFKVLHNIYPTNILLHKMKIKSSTLCEHCGKPDYIEHFFVECDLLQDFWRYIRNFLKSETSIDLSLSSNNILFGLVHNDFSSIKKRLINYINYVILIGKLCISKFRYGKMNNLFLIFEIEMSLRKL